MIRRRRQRTKHAHFGLLVNPQASEYSREKVDALISAIRDADGYYTIFQPDTEDRMVKMARATLGLKRARWSVPHAISRRGKISALVACGGDRTVNVTAGLASEADIPMGILPMGRFNNIARSLLETLNPDYPRIVQAQFRLIDMGMVDKRPFVGSIGFGFVPHLASHLEGRRIPRFAISWSKLGGRAAADIQPVKTVLKLDSFMFEIAPLILNVNLLPYSVGLPLAPASIPDDGHAELIFDQGDQMGEFSRFTRLIVKRQYYFGDGVRLYRGQMISLNWQRSQPMYIDGEIVDVSSGEMAVQILEKQLKVIC